jgi:hypothetical protein
VPAGADATVGISTDKKGWGAVGGGVQIVGESPSQLVTTGAFPVGDGSGWQMTVHNFGTETATFYVWAFFAPDAA